MIVEWLTSVGASIGEWVAGLFPVLDIPTELENLDSSVNSFFETYGAGMGAFANWPLVFGLLALPLVVWVGGLLIRALRAALAHIPFIGGKG